MARRPRVAPGGQAYHVLNRSVGRIALFKKDGDYLAFQQLLIEAQAKHPVRILAYCVMSTHWHFVVWPEKDGEVTAFFRWLAHTHAMRWRVSHDTVGEGHLYQGRFKSFPIQRDLHLLAVCRYVERNPVAAGVVARAQDWQWSSLWARRHGPAPLKAVLTEWPVSRPANWEEWVNRPLTMAEVTRVQTSLKRGRPFGDDAWVGQTVEQLNLAHTVRPEGRQSQV